MTIREQFDQKKRRIMTVLYVGVAFFLVGLLLMPLAKVLGGFLLLLGFFGICLTSLYGQSLAFRCPNCGVLWKSLAMQPSKPPYAIDRRIRYCPFCGVDIDAKKSPKPMWEEADLLI